MRLNLTGDIVRFDQPADTFLRQIPFLAGPNRLDGEVTLDGTTYNVILTR